MHNSLPTAKAMVIPVSNNVEMYVKCWDSCIGLKIHKKDWNDIAVASYYQNYSGSDHKTVNIKSYIRMAHYMA